MKYLIIFSMMTLFLSTQSYASEVMPDNISCSLRTASGSLPDYGYYLRVFKNEDESINLQFVETTRTHVVKEVMNIKKVSGNDLVNVYAKGKTNIKIYLNSSFGGAREVQIDGRKQGAKKSFFLKYISCAGN